MMKKRIFAGLICLLILFCAALNPAAVCAQSAGEVQRLADEIISTQLQAAGASSVQQWVDSQLAEKAGVSSEWYVLALVQRGEYDFSAYRESLLAYLKDRKVSSASTRQKYALTLLATGGADQPYIQATCEDSIGQQGVMSWVYGLHLLNNGCVSSLANAESAVEQLLSLQLQDGGWAVSGAVSDVDVTAMTVQALAPHVQDNPAASEAVSRAVELLSLRQMEDGGYASYGTANPESAAQVLGALSCLGVDGLQDERFIKNGYTLLDGLSRYRLSDGTYSHTLGGVSSQMATVQVLFALTAYQRMMDGKSGMYQYAPASSAAAQESAAPFAFLKELGYKPIAAAAIGLVALLAVIVMQVRKKHSLQNVVAVLLIAAVAVAAVFAIDIQPADSYYSGQVAQKQNPIGQVTLTIRCDTVVGKSDSEYIPQDGVILAETSFAIEEGDTVYDILTEAAQAHGIQMENTGGQGMAYMAGINYLYEYDFGDLSGWVYHVNGQSPSVGCDQYALSDGDVIEWLYTCELGNDLK